jgi:cytochrome c551/c552
MKKAIITTCLSIFYTFLNAQTAIPVDVKALLDKNNCTSCHKVDKKAIGPSWAAISEKQYTVKRFTELVYTPEPANWPTYTPAMAALPKTPKADLKKISVWVNGLTKK